MKELMSAVSELIDDHWVKFVVAAVVTGLGWGLARWRAAREWKMREFLSRVNFSLTTIHDQTLLIRTLAETSCQEVFLNETAVRDLTKAAERTTVDDPVIPLSKDDCWYFLNSVLNELSEQFAAGLIAREAGQSVHSTAFLVCLTNECDGEMRTRKIRALVVRRTLLENLPEEAPKFESAHHHIRWRTLQHLAGRWKKEPWRFLEIELVC